MLELSRPIVFFDLETTGTNPAEDRIVQIACVKLHPNGKKETGCILVNPERTIPKEASDVHGITDAVVANAPVFRSVARDIALWLGDCDLGGYNILNFDIPLLLAEFQRCGITADMESTAIVDALKVYFKYEPRDLSSALKYYTGEDMQNAHDALADVLATIKVVEGQLHKYGDLPKDPQGYFNSSKDPDSVDLSGKLKWKEGNIVMTFGKHKNIPIHKVDRSYWTWAKSKSVFDPVAMKYVEATIRGEVFTKENS